MGARETLLVKLADENGRAMEIYDPQQASAFLNRYVDAIKAPAVETYALPVLPRIGQPVDEADIYAGLCRGENGGADYHLFVHADEKESIQWKDAVEWARGLRNGALQDYNLPTRKEQAVLLGNVPELFKPNWYWSLEAHASDPECAWFQSFGFGYQNYCWKTYDGRARAVRRLTIQ